MHGTLKKRAGRYSRWCNRYFNLVGSRLEYKLTEDASEVRATFDLAPGCRVTDIVVEGQGIRAKKLYTFWLVWPYDKSRDDTGGDGDDSEGEEGGTTSSHHEGPGEPREKGLKQLLSDQQQVAFRNKKIVQKQIEKHHAHDKSVGMVPKFAAVALGGLLVGAFTAGIGLLPYIAVVGGFAVAGGSSAALRYRRPMDSRLVMASDTEAEAKKWMAAITQAISTLEKRRGPRMPSGVNARVVSALTKSTSNGGAGLDHTRWRRCESRENSVRILELVQPPTGFQCRRAHAVVPATPQEAFLALMETPPWPFGQGGSLRVLQAIDNNTDVLCVHLRSDCSAHGGTVVSRMLYLSRFWRMTEDGCYLVTLNGVSVHDIKMSRKGGAIQLDDEDETFAGDGRDTLSAQAAAFASPVAGWALDPTHAQPLFTAVLTVAPRKDHAEYDNEVPETLVCCSLQVADDASLGGAGFWEKGEREEVSAGFLHACLVDLRRLLNLNKYSYTVLDPIGNMLEMSSRDSLLNASPRAALGEVDVDSFKRRRDLGATDVAAGSPQSDKVELKLRDRSDRDTTESKHSIRSAAAAAPVPQQVNSTATGFKASPLADQLSTGQYQAFGYGQNALGPLSRRTGYPRRTLAHEILVSFPNGAGTQDDSKLGKADEKSRHQLRKVFSERPASPMSKANSSTKASLPQALQSEHSRSSFSISRSSVVNNEAASLRGQIAAKEYELHRLQRVAYKRNEPAANDAMSLVQHQTSELEHLKGKYHDLTGATYEQLSTGRRGASSHQLTAFASVHSMSSSSSLLSTSSHRSNDDFPIIPAPPHWLPTKMERAEWEGGDSMQSNKYHTDLSVVLLVSICILATIFGANLLSTI